MAEFFPEVKNVKFEGPGSKNPLAFKHYNAKEKVLGKSMADHLRFAVCYWHTFKGLGGVRVPVVLELSAPDTGEKIYAQKLMVYTCQFFPTMKQNVTPVLPGITYNGDPWPENEVMTVTGRTEIPVAPVDFSALQEDYVVPSLELKPVKLTEAWKLTSMTTSGTMSSYELGGTDLAGTTERYANKWKPDQKSLEPKDVDFWFVVRDGRGGNSWTKRTIHWSP